MKTIKGKILIYMVSILVLSLLVVGSVSIYMNYRSTIDSIEQTLTESVEIAVNQVDAKLEQYRMLATELAAQQSMQYNDRENLITEFRAIEQRHRLSSAGRTDVNGISLENGENLSVQEYFVQAKNSGSACVSDPEVSKEDGTLRMYIAAPILIEGRFDGVFYMSLDAQFLCDMVANIHMGETGNAAILDKNGTTLAYADLQTVLDRYNTQEEVKNDPSLARLAALEREMMEGNSGFGSYSYGGVEKFFAYAPVPHTNGWSMDVSVVQEEFLSGTKIAIFYMIAIVVICLLMTVFAVFRLSEAISKPIRLCMQRIQLLAKGDLKTAVPEISFKDETGQLADATETIVNTMGGIVQDISWGLEKMASGDFTVDSQVKHLYVGDFEAMAHGMYGIMKQLSMTLLQINQAAEQVSSGSEQMASGAQALSQGATEQASSIEELAATISEISDQVGQNAQNAQNANTAVITVKTHAEESNDRMRHMLEAMHEISESSDEIGKIIKTIEDIAFQTNILALNAAVEAARAGAAGKGFAVVADEVRNLAIKSAEASKNTAGLIAGSLQAVDNGTKIADETARALGNVIHGVQEITGIIQQISTASGEQADSIGQVTLGIDQISGVVQTNSATAEESAAASEELSSQAQMLKELVGQFKIKNDLDALSL